MKLVLLRHGESLWNEMNLFTGWTDIDLTEKGRGEAAEAGRLLAAEGFDFDVCFTSYLKRAVHTLNIVLDEMDRDWLPVYKTWKLNERHYGALQGLNKAETAEKYGEEQVKIWRRSFAVTPPTLAEDDDRNPVLQAPYRNVDPEVLPLTESLETTIERVLPYYMETVYPVMSSGKRVLIAAHGNSLRALVKVFDGLDNEEITRVNIPTGIPLVYEFDEDGNVMDKHYLGDKAAIEARIHGVEQQGNPQ